VNKPAGLVVNKAKTVKEETLEDWLEQKLGAERLTAKFWQNNLSYQDLMPAVFDTEFGQPLEIWQERRGIIHRLDKDTSGILVLAKNPGALLNLLAQFKNRQTKKTYLALVHGHFDEKHGHIIAPMSRSIHNRLKFAVNSEGRVASTDYQVKNEFTGLKEDFLPLLVAASRFKMKKVKELYQAGFSLLQLEPKTGRTHQIRVHMSTMQHPIVGDRLYAGKKRIKLDAFWCKRQFLHATAIEFTHPRTKNKMLIEAPLANDLKTVLSLVL
jgi:23S rRNA pseudouridine1911/1915/1917 synthase